MKIAVINGTEKRGVTYRMKEFFLEQFRDDSEITEYYLPKDGPGFCMGCTACFRNGQTRYKDFEKVQKIEKSMLEADLLVFTSPAYVFHTTGAMKAMLDHFGYRWMPHRPAKEMFGKRAVIITQCLGAGGKSAAKDIKDSLSWWGISTIKVVSFKLMSEIDWEKIEDNRKASFKKKLDRIAQKMRAIDYSRPGHTGVVVKAKFYAVRMLQTSLGKQNPEYTDFKYWNENGWIGKVRPWKCH
ncbi:MAG: NAD(P)H-dependent oxidoreductase [Lachnospiraceae bacterium]|nr:NAD(P)H-dependent oxidoreductase [Lachnospiraceae bacterium]